MDQAAEINMREKEGNGVTPSTIPKSQWLHQKIRPTRSIIIIKTTIVTPEPFRCSSRRVTADGGQNATIFTATGVQPNWNLLGLYHMKLIIYYIFLQVQKVILLGLLPFSNKWIKCQNRPWYTDSHPCPNAWDTRIFYCKTVKNSITQSVCPRIDDILTTPKMHTNTDRL